MNEQLEFSFKARAPGGLDPKAARREYMRKWRAKNPDKEKAAQRTYYQRNAEKRGAKARAWEDAHPDRVRERARISQRIRHHRRRDDPVYRLRKAMAARLHSALKFCGGKKSARTITLLGCTARFLVNYLESKFLPGMTWANYGKGGGKWNIDHRIAFHADGVDLTKPETQRLICHWTNLQPMWEPENLRKGKRIAHEHQFPLIVD